MKSLLDSMPILLLQLGTSSLGVVLPVFSRSGGLKTWDWCLVRFVARDVISLGTLSWTWGLESITLSGGGACFADGRDSLFWGSSVGDMATTGTGLDSLEDRYVGSAVFLLSLCDLSDFAFG